MGRRQAARSRRQRRVMADLARGPDIYIIHLRWRLPRDLVPVKSAWEDCDRLVREWIECHRGEIDLVARRIEQGTDDDGPGLDDLYDDALAWARAHSEIDFLTHDPCPYY